MTILPLHAAAESPSKIIDVRNVDLQLAAREKNARKIGSGIHFFRLYCALGSCELERLSVNECQTIGSTGSGFTPRAQHWTTAAGNLDVTTVSENTVRVKVFQGSHHQLPAVLTFVFVPEIRFSTRVTAFEGAGFINEKLFPHSLETIEYVSITGPAHSEPIDCPVMVPRLESPRRAD